MKFRKKVPGEIRELLEGQYKEYIKNVKMTSEERRALKDWVAGGRSPYDNPNSIYTEDGYLMDFVGAMRCHGIYCDYDPFAGDVVFKAADDDEDLLRDDKYYFKTEISKDILVTELQDAVNVMADRGFVSYKDVMKLQHVIFPILDKLEYLAECDASQAMEAGKEMIRILTDIETDDDNFPNYELELIQIIL